MSKGFNKRDRGKIKSDYLEIDKNELDNLLKKYKQIKKYQKSSIYEIHKLSGTETIISKLLDDNKSA
jgi:hypothetical protein